MKTKPLEPQEINLAEIAKRYSNENQARKFLESLRWPNGPVCPRCKNDGSAKTISKLEAKNKDSESAVRKGVYFCGACRKQFTVTIGTVFEGSHIPISKWVMALFIICSSKKAMSAHQLHRMLGITYKSAWFMFHRIRFAFGNDKRMLAGIVEADETFVGGKGERRTRFQRQTPVMALVERGGAMQARVIPTVTQKNVGKYLHETVSKDAVVNTDEHSAYRNPLKDWKQHNTVIHSKFEYSRTNADGTKSGINCCESFFSLLKRGVYGSWHCVSPEHLQKYADEFAFRWNHRKMTDGERMVAAIPFMEGRRLLYRQPAN